jgi:hypothetical protein
LVELRFDPALKRWAIFGCSFGTIAGEIRHRQSFGGTGGWHFEVGRVVLLGFLRRGSRSLYSALKGRNFLLGGAATPPYRLKVGIAAASAPPSEGAARRTGAYLVF